MTIELQQIPPWFQTAFGVRMRPEMGRSTEGTVNRSMSRNRGHTSERKERKRGRLITRLRKAREQKRFEMALNLASWRTSSRESREGIRLMGKIMWPMVNHWVSGGWDISCGGVQPAIKTSRTSEKKMLDLNKFTYIAVHGGGQEAWDGLDTACRIKDLFKKRGFGDT